jgi:hypothetical protein
VTDFYKVRVVDGRHHVGITTNGLDWLPIPTAAFGTPREAIRYAAMRQAGISPLRPALDDSAGFGDPPSRDVSSAARSGQCPAPGSLPRPAVPPAGRGTPPRRSGPDARYGQAPSGADDVPA